MIFLILFDFRFSININIILFIILFFISLKINLPKLIREEIIYKTYKNCDKSLISIFTPWTEINNFTYDRFQLLHFYSFFIMYSGFLIFFIRTFIIKEPIVYSFLHFIIISCLLNNNF